MKITELEHEARCDLIDAIGMLSDMALGVGGPTEAEKIAIRCFVQRMREKYPMQKAALKICVHCGVDDPKCQCWNDL